MSKELLDEIAAIAEETGTTVYVVGGYVRDRLLGREPVDLDLLVEGGEAAFLEALSRRAGFEPIVFSRRDPVTHRIAMGDWLVDVSSCPDGGLNAALARRDFTINTLAAKLRPRGLGAGDAGPLPIEAPRDLLGGLRDLRDRRIRHVTPEALEHDPVRLLRAVRLAAVLDGFRLDPGLIAEMTRRAALIEKAAPERTVAELEVILASPRAGQALRVLLETGLLLRLFPELKPLAGLEQNRWHRYDVLEHTLRAVEAADALQQGVAEIGVEELGVEEAEILKWAALLHDTGKAATARTGADGTRTFHGHESISADIAREALARLRCGRRKADRVLALVASHLRLTLLSAAEPVSDRAVRRLVHRVGNDTPLQCLLALADRRAGGGPDFERRYAALVALAARVMRLFLTEGSAVIAPAPLVTGEEVMRILDIPPGPRVGAVLRWITRLQVEDKITRRDDAMRLLGSLPPSRIVTQEDDA